MDFNLMYDDCGEKDLNIDEKIKKAFALGYETVAINTRIPSTDLDVKKVKVPEPKEVDLSGHPQRKKLRVLNRLTAVIRDGIHGHNLSQSSTGKRYDIIAVQPVGEKMLQHACSSMEIDIISLDLSECLPFHLKRTYMNQAKEKGITFEIQYAPCLRDQNTRRWLISNAQMLVQVLKGKNIIVSSGALKILELRGVHDVVNLCHLFGFKENLAKAAVMTNGKIVMSHAGTRRKTGCGYVSVEEVFRLSNQHRWLVSACSVPPKKQEEEKAVADLKGSKDALDKETLESEPSAKKQKLEICQDHMPCDDN